MVRDTNDTTLDAFRDATQSLKLYRRAELLGEGGAELISELYVDPLPNDHVLKTLLKPNTTFLVGRKGTGKSTIFQMAQHELRKRNDVTTAYIDIKSVYEASRPDTQLLDAASMFDGVLPQASLERLQLSKYFVAAIIESIKNELEKRVAASFWERVKLHFGGSIAELFQGLDDLLEDAGTTRFDSVVGAYAVSKKEAQSQADASEWRSKNQFGAKANVSPVSSASGLIGRESSTGRSTSTNRDEELEHVEVLMRVFDLKGLLGQLRTLLRSCGIRQLYVFLDDFSELPEAAMRVVVDALLAPLNNWSEEMIKFKVAAYPSRIYYGEIDKTKTDEINLDLFSLYGTSDLVVMEEKATDFTKRLITRRLEHFGILAEGQLFESSQEGELWRQLFHASMANPRNLGWLLHFAYESSLLYGKRIGSAAIRDAARRFYEEKIEASFEMNKFLSESFSERSSIFSLKDLLDALVNRARELRNSPSSVLRELDGRAPSSHFHISLDRESLLNSLELNFFVTKYYVMSDRDGNKVAVYALNYGLCQKRSIEFGRPRGSREKRYRQYFAERVFDFTPVLDSYVRNNQEITCDTCGVRQEIDSLSALKAYGMLCPACKAGTCQVVNLSRKYEAVLNSVSESSLLPRVELGILQALDSESRPLNASDVAAELDCSYQLIGRRVKNLDERGLVNRDEYEQNKRVYRPTRLAKDVYFASSPEAHEDGEASFSEMD